MLFILIWLFSYPALVFISRADKLIDQMGIFRLMKSWHEKGVPVYSLCWTDASHVQMLRVHPQEYGDLVDAFHSRVTETSLKA